MQRFATLQLGRVSSQVLGFLALFVVLYLISITNYLLYHSLAEVFSIVIGFAIFVFAWTARRHLGRGFLVFIGTSYLFVAGLDLLHTFAYKGMDIFGHASVDIPTQLWIAARLVQAFSLLLGMLLIGKSLRPRAGLAIQGVISAGLLLAIFYWHTFPVCYVEGLGLTPFKVVAEYVVCVALLAALFLLVRRRHFLDHTSFAYLTAALIVTVIAELSFTLYVDVYGFFNFLGHFFKILSFYLLYRAIIEVGLVRPFSLLFRELQHERSHLESRVAERTAALTLSNQRLQTEIEKHDAATRALAHREARFRNLVENANNVILQFDLRGKVVFFNHYAQKLFGYSEEELLGKHINTIVPPEDRRGVSLRDLIASIIASPERYAVNENENLTRDGRHLWISWSNQGVYDEDGNMIGVMSIGTDRTAERDSQRALAASEERFRTFMENSPVSAFIKDGGGSVVYSNLAGAAQFDMTVEDILGKTDHDLWPHDAAERTIADDNHVRDTGEPLQQIEQLEVRGHLRTYLVSRFRIPSATDRPQVGVMARDITELIEAQQAREQSEQRYRELIENAGTIVLLWDRSGTIQYLNPYALQLFGYEEHEIVGQNVTMLVPATEASGRSLEGLAQAIANDPERYASVENENVTKDGRRLWIAWSNRALHDADGNFNVIMAIGIDRSRQRQVEEALLDNQQRLRRLASELSLAEERERRRLATEIHDNLSQTLAFARMQVSALLNSGCAEDFTKPLASLQELLEAAVADTRSITFQLSPPVLYQVGLEAAVEWLGEQTEQRHDIKFHYERDKAEKPLTDDVRTVLFQAMRELFANMIKHSQAANVTVRMQAPDDYLQVVVEDDGVGFDPEQVQWTAERTSGYGLFNIKERLEYIGGSLQITSAPGRGAKFQLTAP
ncbi:MAG: MASE3 domain-containing protein, partial [Armatimonadia bacterium]